MRISGSDSACSVISANRALRVKPGHRDYKSDEALMLQDGQKTVLVRQETKILHSAFNKVQNTLEFYQRDEGKIATWLPYEEYSDCTWQSLQEAVASKLKCKDVVLYKYSHGCSNLTVPTEQLVSDVFKIHVKRMKLLSFSSQA